MKKTVKITLMTILSLISASTYAYRYDIKINPSVTAGGGQLKYTKKVVLGGFEPEIFHVQNKQIPAENIAKRYETAGICMWGSEFEILGGPFKGEKIIIKHDQTSGNVCSGRSFILGTPQEFVGVSGNITVGQQGKLAVLMSNI